MERSCKKEANSDKRETRWARHGLRYVAGGASLLNELSLVVPVEPVQPVAPGDYDFAGGSRSKGQVSESGCGYRHSALGGINLGCSSDKDAAEVNRLLDELHA